MLALAFLIGAAILAGPILAAPDEDALGKADGYPPGTAATMFAERFKVGSFTATDKILPTRRVARPAAVSPLEKGPGATIAYQFRGTRYTLADYLQRRRVTGLLVLKDGRIVAEHYGYGRTDSDRFLSFSMAKSVTSLLIGIALEKGLIHSLDDPAEKYVTELKATGYGRATVRQLLHMSSGVKFVEEYNGRDDVAKLVRAERGLSGQSPLAVLASFAERSAPAGEKLGYASSEASVLGYVAARAAGATLADLTSQWIWQPLGAEADAAWNLGVDGQERSEGYFNATLRDFGRLGLLLANDGRVGSKQIVSPSYLLDATAAARQPPAFRPRTATPYYGYGYLFWLFPFRCRTFALLGIYGQGLFVQPESKIVMVHTAVCREPRDADAGAERDALWRGVLAALGGQTNP